MRRPIALFLAASLSLGFGVPASAEDSYVPEDLEWPADSVMFSIVDEGTTFMNNSILISSKSGSGENSGQKSCDSFDDANCRFSGKFDSIGGASVLPKCETADAVNCIEALEISIGDAEFKPAIYKESIGGIEIAPKPSIGYPGGRTVSLWSAPDSPATSGVTDYAVAVRIGGVYDSKRSQKWEYGEFSANVTPYRVITGDRYQDPYQMSEQFQDKSWHTGLGGHALECAWSDLGRCGRSQNFAPDTKIRLTLRLPKEVGGWFRGRMKDPVIAISSFNSKFNRFVIQAEPVQVQKFAIGIQKSAFTPYEAKLHSEGGGGMKGGIGHWRVASQQGIFDYINYFKDKVSDTAAGVTSLWSMGSVNTGGGSGCMKDDARVMGIVTTNALGYDGASPAYSGGFLNYNVGGLHFNPDGKTEFLGTYDLVMRSDVARCLYGFNKAPISATISVAGGDSNTVATTVVSEKNGWLKLAAYGFTYSNKKIKVKLSQKKTSITCVSISNPRLTKKVTNYGPTCPSGFKKK